MNKTIPTQSSNFWNFNLPHQQQFQFYGTYISINETLKWNSKLNICSGPTLYISAFLKIHINNILLI